MHIIGIDPGSRFTGYGIIQKEGSDLRHVASGRINASKHGTLLYRLEVIYDGLRSVLEEFPCDAASAETIFTSKNPMSSLKLGHARGVAILALRHARLDIHEYAPTKVKQTITGSGRATKATVSMMVGRALRIDPTKLSEDAGDALAVAICHASVVDFLDKLE